MEEIDNLFKSSKFLEGNCSGIYFLFDGNELVYIGKGWNCLLRIAEHTRKDSDKKFTSWNYISINDINEYNRIEKELIKKHNPKYNKTHNNQKDTIQ
ncbi:GIY-YIG nuclease family protein [Flavobacterium sp. M31R6]|uniref:GIY-YIG nuclease family protein n=1 Tax=Flavobacterium sp. M31R6 TaxID=2739062 RepID=UPI0015693B0D|nr:GIY-YIG nuclease family protein [Flavobacterium sp. M31R6]QKJ62400.1 GIY-YIG nuclease family protein [Flavobacterium sp. M31R6]